MESVGEFFRQVRETKGLTIDEVASKTRIRTDFVKALEDGNFAKLPDQVFARGFVRSYARSLGLDEEDAVHRFIQSAGSFYEKQDERERLKLRQVEEEQKRRSNRKVIAIVIGVTIVTLTMLLSREQSTVFRRGGSDQTSVKRTAHPAKETQDAAKKQDVEPVAETAKPTDAHTASTQATGEAHRAESNADPAPASKPDSDPSGTVSTVSSGSDGPLAGIGFDRSTSVQDGQLVLDLEATELSWVVIQIDNGSPQETLLRAGEKGHWKGQDQFILTLGNAGGVKAELNGKPQKPFGPSGKVARDIVLKR